MELKKMQRAYYIVDEIEGLSEDVKKLKEGKLKKNKYEKLYYQL